MCFHMFFNPTLTCHGFQLVFHGFHTFHNFPWPGQPGATAQTVRLPMCAGQANGKCEMCDYHEKSIDNNEKSKLDGKTYENQGKTMIGMIIN